MTLKRKLITTLIIMATITGVYSVASNTYANPSSTSACSAILGSVNGESADSSSWKTIEVGDHCIFFS